MAYCPYSRFPVGAAILTADGAIITGNDPTGDSAAIKTVVERGECNFEVIHLVEC